MSEPTGNASTTPSPPGTGYETLGGYRLERRLGVGGVGEVWLGRHLQTEGLAAVKRLRDDASSAVVRRFFRREGRVIARLSHPHIVPFFDCGADYLITAYVEGPTLSRHLNTPIEPARAVRIFLQVASALLHAHEQGIVHRDVKPANILLDAQGNAYLTDFGIALVEHEAQGEGGRDRSGTPAYMAPEQKRGERVGAAADQYSLARTLMVMLVGVGIPTDREKALEALPEKLPGPLREALARATARSPEQRWSSVRDFAQRVAAVDLQGWAAPVRLAHEVRPEAPFAWVGGARRHHRATEDLSRADYRLSELVHAGLLPAEAADALRERFGYEDLGWSVMGSENRLGPIWEPGAFARVSEVMVLLHGWSCTREVWSHIAPALCRDNAKALVLALDHSGAGESTVRRTDHCAAQQCPAGLTGLVLSWMELLGLKEIPSVLVGHSMAAVALVSQPDEVFEAHCTRVGLTPIFQSPDSPYARRLRRLERVMRLGFKAKTLFRGVGRALARLAPETGDLAPEVRRRFVDDIFSIPPWQHSLIMRNYFGADYPHARDLRRCMVVIGASDPMATEDAVERAVQRMELSPVQVRRMATGGHYPHLESASHPEWTARNTYEIVRIIDEMLGTSRAGTVVSTAEGDTAATVAEVPSRE